VASIPRIWGKFAGHMRAIVIQHVAMEGPARIAELCHARGIDVEVRHVYAGDDVPEMVGRDEILIVMGGGMGVADCDNPRYGFLRAELALLGAALRAQRPVLGVCLGAQLLAHAAGARVYPNVIRDMDGREIRAPEVGWAPVTFVDRDSEPALAGLEPTQVVLHWHGDTFDLPNGAVRLAFTPSCAQQAFRLGSRAFGLQFHVEVDGEIARRWAVEDSEFVRAARGTDGPALIANETERCAVAAQAAGDRLIGNILGCLTVA
jgi:GMP synthase (glutamine-hydrolysing)